MTSSPNSGALTFGQAVRTYFGESLLALGSIALAYGVLVPELVRDWFNDENASHGPLIPLISCYFIWRRREDLKNVQTSPSAWGLVLVFAGLVMLAAGSAGAEYFSMRLSIIPILAGSIMFAYGTGAARILALPLAFLAFMVPVPSVLYDSIAFPLKLFVTKVSAALLVGVGIPVLKEGNILMFPDITLVVADACSGMRSMVSLLALSVAFAFIFEFSKTAKAVIILSAVPIAIVTNILRVFITGVLVEYVSTKAADGFFHEFAGMSVFVLAMIMLAAEGALLRKLFR